MKLSKIVVDYLIKKVTSYTPNEILELDEKNKSLENELKKVPLHLKYEFGIMGKKGFCVKNRIFEEKDINNSSKKIPFINPFSTCVAVIGESGSGKSLLTSKILVDSKKILYFGCMDRDYYKSSQRNFLMELNETDAFLFKKDDTTYHSHEINFYNMDKEDIVSIDMSSEIIEFKHIESCYAIFETFIFNAIKNGYSIVFAESYNHLDNSLNTNKFTELISFAYDRLKIEMEQLKIEAINNNAKIIISTNNRIFKDVLFSRMECSYYIDELILMDSFNSRNIKSFKELEETYSFFLGNYFKYHLIQNHTKVGDYIHFEKLEDIK